MLNLIVDKSSTQLCHLHFHVIPFQITVGDVVTHVDGCALRQLSLPQVRDLIRGPPEK